MPRLVAPLDTSTGSLRARARNHSRAALNCSESVACHPEDPRAPRWESNYRRHSLAAALLSIASAEERHHA